jgi:hypothetical protein
MFSESDIAELVSLFLSCFGIGFLMSYLLRIFIRASGYIAR